MTALEQQLINMLEEEKNEQAAEKKELMNYLGELYSYLGRIHTQNNEIATLLKELIEVFGQEQEKQQKTSQLDDFKKLLETSLSRFQIGLVESLKQVLRP